MDKDNKPVIKVSKNGPLIVKNLKSLRNSKGVFIETRSTMTLCRCGGSENKPFCDGMHLKNGFSGEKKDDCIPDKVDSYEGKHITIHNNRGVCSHIGHCVFNLPSVFRKGMNPWIDPDGAEPEEIIKLIKTCPSGALSYTINGELHKEYPHDPEIFITRDGPYNIVGGIKLDDPDGSKPETQDHYALCRCSASKNKPFCDGTHLFIEFKDRKN
ncbi:CDGSH iron-sulfur domain-containing protein [Methanolobus mangrovi]|uniref:CDGSH iron-sulfur domain-containing protein n=1 Tax=Methanolobus mangrovi TaxID=3072977 RepID=A0AA51UH04_9EURY|nr:CDGSH iron-sulfur domain-containing protein [Methanolobus mangrovi]WMW22975.1 CDGSH iron-sulfur domain-containing protein [Methanolobus mangrovi]